MLHKFEAVAAALVRLLHVEAGDLGTTLPRELVESHAADDVVIDGHHTVVGNFFVDILVSSRDQLGTADDASDHSKQLGNVVFTQFPDDAVAIGVDHRADAFV